jgi:hypothetical protein
MISERNFERRVDRFRSRIAEEHAIEIAGRQRRDPAGELKRRRMRELERRRIVEFLGCAFDRRDDRVAVVAGIGAP